MWSVGRNLQLQCWLVRKRVFFVFLCLFLNDFTIKLPRVTFKNSRDQSMHQQSLVSRSIKVWFVPPLSFHVKTLICHRTMKHSEAGYGRKIMK